jgi:putative membrane protein
MHLFASICTVLIALLHVYILILEMFLWDKPLGLKSFGIKRDYALATKVLAANQGLYNGFLALGLLWGVYLGQAGDSIKIFFLSCVIVAGVFGAITANRKILFVQAIPGSMALMMVLLSRIT